MMNDNSLYFELFSITLLLVIGTLLLAMNLPGWGLISSAVLLSLLSFGLRKTALLGAKTAPTAGG